MNDTLQCPGCHVRLALPALPEGQAVLCPRCAQSFEMDYARANVAPSAVPIMAVEIVESARTHEEPDDDVDDFNVGQRAPGSFRGDVIAKATVLFLALSMLSCCVQIYVNFETWRIARNGVELGVRGRINGRHRAPDPPAVVELERRHRNIHETEELVGLAQFTVLVPTTICFLAWLYTAYGNLSRILKAKRLTFSPALAVISILTPLANLLCPYMVVQELWRASHPRAVENGSAWQATARSRLVCAWWLLCLVGPALWFLGALAASHMLGANFGDDAGFDMFGPTFRDEMKVAIFTSLTHLSLLVAAVLLIAIVRGVTRRQRERYAHLYGDLW